MQKRLSVRNEEELSHAVRYSLHFFNEDVIESTAVGGYLEFGFAKKTLFDHVKVIPAPKPRVVVQNFSSPSLDHLKKGASKCGVYKIYDSVGNSFPVYCDMKTEPGNAWTLVMSWSYRNNGLLQFKARPFRLNAPVKENAPNFNLYRQTLSRMQSIKSHSTHWRATCSYPTHGIDYMDYVRGSFRDFDVMTYLRAGVCKKVGYTNIRGHVGIHTTARWWQGSSYFLHVDSIHRGCRFVPVVGAVGSEDNFGHYNVVNPNFRCTVNDKATTQWRFVEHLTIFTNIQPCLQS